jgi:hypothetical protein
MLLLTYRTGLFNIPYSESNDLIYLFAAECKYFFQIAIFLFVCFAAYYWIDEIKEVKMEGACDTYGIKLHVGFGTTPLGGPKCSVEGLEQDSSPSS